MHCWTARAVEPFRRSMHPTSRCGIWPSAKRIGLRCHGRMCVRTLVLGRSPALCWSFDAGMRCDEVCNCRRHLGAKPHVWNLEDALVLTSKQGPPAPTLHIGSVVIGEAQSIRLSVVQNDRPMLGVAQIAGVWSEISPGVYEQRPFVFSMSGKWRARVLVRPRTAAVAAATFAVNAREQALARKESLRLRGQCLHT